MTDANSCTATTTGDDHSAERGDSQFLQHGDSVQRRNVDGVTVSAEWRHAWIHWDGDFSIPAGTYSYTVTDSNGCTATTTGDDHSAQRGDSQFLQHGDSVQRW